MTSKKRVVILGAGFGGLRAAYLISKKIRSLRLADKYEIILIDRNEHHTYTPLLYEVATTSKKTADLAELHGVVAYGLAKLLKKLPVSVIKSEIEGIDFANGSVILANEKKIAADFILLALGSETNYFGVRGLEENSFSLKSLIDALKIRDTILDMLTDNKKELDIVIGGGGSTGVELAGELKMWCGELSDEYRRCRINVSIIEGAAAILPGFSPRIISLVKKRLHFLKVNIIEGEIIESVDKNRARLKSGKEIPFDIFVWAGGVKAPSLVESAILKTEARGRLEVKQGMQCLPKTSDLKISPKIYAIGDNTCVYDPKTKKQIPGVARAAISEANIAAHNVVEEIKSEEFKNYKPRLKTYMPKNYPYIIPVGGKFAVAKIGPIVISGFLGWILKGLVELNYLASIMPLGRAIGVWLKGLKIFIQNDRLG